MNINRNIINIACWSIGQHAIKNILPAIHLCENVILLGIYTRNTVNATEQCKLYGCKQYFDEVELLQDNSIDAVYLSSPTGVHYEQILKCLDAGKSVLVEKTAFSSLIQAEELVLKARQSNLLIMEAFMYRFHNQFKLLKKLLESKKYGEVIRIDCSFGFPHLAADNIRYNNSLCGGSTYDAGAYTLSAARLLLGGDPSIEWASIINFPEFNVDTQGHAILTFQNAVANCTWAFGASYSNSISVWCENGIVLCDRAFSKSADYPSLITVEQNGSIVETIHSGSDNHFINMLVYFSESLVSKNHELELSELLKQSNVVNNIFLLNGA
jgi:NDP-hexose-3-ketoreductase